jgi:hypothetical protein
MSHGTLKAISSGLVAAGLDNYINEKDNFNPDGIGRSLTFGAVVAGSVVASHYIAPSLTNMVPIPDTALFSGKTLEHRLIEVTIASGASIGVSNYVFQSSLGPTVTKIGIVVLADVIGEYIADYAHSKPLSYLQ